MTLPAPSPASFADRKLVLDRLTAWIDEGAAGPQNRAVSVWGGALAAALSISLGSLLTAQAGGAEPLMAVFPILLVTCLRLGATAGWICLLGGLIGAWYVYLGQQFSFVINAQEARALIMAFAVGLLMMGVCLLLRSSQARVQASDTASRALTEDLVKRGEELVGLNASLTKALEERIHAEDALTLSEAQFRASFENAAVGKVQTEPRSGRIVRVNAAFAAMLGYRPDELVDRDGWELTLDEDRDADRAAYDLVLSGQQAAYIREKRYVRRDGQPIWGRVSATLTRSPKTGEPLLTVAVVENIDTEYKAKIALVAAKQDLEISLAERTDALAQRDVLLREVYHRVKNNLQIIDSFLVLQRARLTDPEARAALSALRSRVFALGLVHHQLMGSSDLKTFDISPFLVELSRNIAQGGIAKDVSISVHAVPLTVGLDFAIPLGLIMTELVTNSLKHAFPSHSGAIEVRLEGAPDNMVILTVSDDGVGASASLAAAEGATTSLGTTIIEALVKQLGGHMRVQRDHGSRTEIHVPGPRPE